MPNKCVTSKQVGIKTVIQVIIIFEAFNQQPLGHRQAGSVCVQQKVTGMLDD